MTIVILLLKYTNHAFTYILQNILILFQFSESWKLQLQFFALINRTTTQLLGDIVSKGTNMTVSKGKYLLPQFYYFGDCR